MSDDDILKVARETGAWHICPQGREELLITFANRIAAMQREIDAGICEQIAKNGEAGLCATAIREQSDG